MEEALGKIFGNWSMSMSLGEKYVKHGYEGLCRVYSFKFRCFKDYMRAGFYHLRQKNISIVMVGGIVGHYSLFKYPKKGVLKKITW